MSTSLEAKVVLLGSQNAGKTSLINRYVLSTFLPPTIQPTIGANFYNSRTLDPETNTTVRLQIWDTAGQERFRSISKLYYRGANVVLLCYDITSKRSFDEAAVWLRELREKSQDEQTIIHIVGTKSDIVAEDPSRREVPFERCIDFVTSELYPETTSTQPTRPSSSLAMRSSPPSQSLQTHNIMSPQSNRSSGFWNHENVWDCCHEVSAKDGEGIDEVFRVITRKLVDQHLQRLDKQKAIEATMGMTPGFDKSGASYFDLPTNGSFRLGHGDKRRSWLGLQTPGGALSSHPEEEADDVAAYKSRKGRCC